MDPNRPIDVRHPHGGINESETCHWRLVPHTCDGRDKKLQQLLSVAIINCGPECGRRLVMGQGPKPVVRRRSARCASAFNTVSSTRYKEAKLVNCNERSISFTNVGVPHQMKMTKEWASMRRPCIIDFSTTE